MNANLLPPIDLEHAIVITDDNHAKKFLALEGKLGQLEPEPPRNTASITWRSANTNALCHAVNFRVNGDEGYVIVILPSEHYNEEKAAYTIAVVMAASSVRPGTESFEMIHPEHN